MTFVCFLSSSSPSYPLVFFFLQCGLYAEEPLVKKSKSLPEAPPLVQEFVWSVERNFLAYMQKKLQAVFGNSQEKFLAVCGDLGEILPTKLGYLIWICKYYEDLMRILAKAKESERFIF